MNKKIILVSIDFLIIVFSLSISYSLRLEEYYPFWKINKNVILIYLITFYLFFFKNQLYQIVLRFFDYYSIIKILKSIVFITILLIFLNFYFNQYFFFPRSISFIAPFFIGLLIILSRILINFLINLKHKQKKFKNNNILIYGIDQNTVSLARNIRQIKSYGSIIGFVDHNGNYKKRQINGIDIYKKENLINIIDKKNINEIIINQNFISKKKIKKILNQLDKRNIKIKKILDNKNFIKNSILNNFKSDISFYDIIDRPQVKVSKKILKKQIENKAIVVTGGGGSIGSELISQIIKNAPKKIYVIDISEINLYKIRNKINNFLKFSNISVEYILGDCGNLDFLKLKFKNIKIDDIYHAAAYKHVEFGEKNIYSICKNNIIGTKNIIEFSISKKIKNFIFISTDKAVNPKSVLGFTKKIGELIINFYYKKYQKLSNTKFTIVRFGNVIGSSGSVIPLFLKQLNEKKYLTVTDKNVKRYFMSISEAIELVIVSSNLNKKGLKIFALDMGNQIKIYDIAKRIIRLSGYSIKSPQNPSGEISIKFIGLKKGEKISEEISLGKNLIKTNNNKIFLCEESLKLLSKNEVTSFREEKLSEFNYKKLKLIVN